MKALFEYPTAVVCTSVRQVENALRHGKDILYRPAWGRWRDIDSVFQMAYDRRAVTVYNDERGGWPRPFDIDLLPGEANAIMRGRAREVSVWTGTQRPSRVPLATMTESDHFLVFRLQNYDDRKKVSGFAGDEIKDVILPMRYFWYSGPASDGPVLYPPIADSKRKHRG